MKYIRRIIIIFIISIFIFNIKAYAKGLVIVIDPGHGGIDSGSTNKSAGIIEKDVNLKIARYLKQYLEEYDVGKVIMTHNGFSSRKMIILDRAKVARENNADLLISIHCNASDTSKSVNGAEAYVTANTYLKKYHEECYKLADMILNNIHKLGIKKIGVKTRLSGLSTEKYSDGTKADYYGIIRCSMKGVEEGPGADIRDGSGIPTVLVEHCYIQNGDEKYINNEKGIQNLARADCDAIVQYYGLRLKNTYVTSVSLDKKNITIAKGDIFNLTATVYPDTATNKKVIWSSSNEKVAQVYNGKVIAINEGETIITAKTNDGGYTATCKILVQKIDVDINNEKIYTLEQDLTKVSYKVVPYLPNNYKVKFDIEDKDIAEINENDIIKSKQAGNTKMRIKVINETNDVISEKEIPIEVNKLEEGEFIKIENYKEENSILTRINPNTLKDDFCKNIIVSEGLEIEIDKNGQFVGTGTKIIIKRKAKEDETDRENKIIKTYTCIIYGDVNCDGKISTMDYTLIKNHIMDVKKITEYNIVQAADVNGDNRVSTLDYTLIKNHIMDVKKIVAR